MRERDLRQVNMQYMEAEEAEVDELEGIGALNFLQIDDITVCKEGELINPDSIIQLPTHLNLPIIPNIEPKADAPFLWQL